MKTMPLKARLRTKDEMGTRACKKLRRSGELPANLYGAREADGRTVVDSWTLAVSAWDATQLVEKRAWMVEVRFGKEQKLALVKQLQRDSMGDDLIHLDLAVIDPNKPVQVGVPLVFKGDAKGVKAGGGRLIAEIRVLQVLALPKAIPEEIVVKVEHLEIDDKILVKDLTLPEGVKTELSPDQLVVQVLPPALLEVEATPAAPGPAEPEVIGLQSKEEPGEEGAAPAEKKKKDDE